MLKSDSYKVYFEIKRFRLKVQIYEEAAKYAPADFTFGQCALCSSTVSFVFPQHVDHIKSLEKVGFGI